MSYQFLRNMDTTQQISALFLAVFGVLVGFTAYGFLQSLREQPDTPTGDARRMELYNARGLLQTSWLMVTVFWVGWVLGDRVANALFGFVAFFALL